MGKYDEQDVATYNERAEPPPPVQDAPERIWLSRDYSQTVPTDILPFAFKSKKYDDDVEYVRADLSSDPRIEAIRQALKKCEPIVRHYGKLMEQPENRARYKAIADAALAALEGKE